jgi:predicted ATP-binding protein involved in virulence
MEPSIRKFTILGLFGEKDVSIDLTSGITILIADNGLGKTTILTVIYAVLAGQLHRLRRV